MSAHPTDDVLHDHVDGALSSVDERDVARHLGECARCVARVDSVRSLHAAAASLPRIIEPGEDLWPAVRGAIDGRKMASISASRRRRPRWMTLAGLAAAGVVLVTASSLITLALVRDARDGRGSASAVAGSGRVEGATSTHVPASAPAANFAGAEADYIRAAEELYAAVQAQRDALSPMTVATVERNLRIIDQAIGEARAALVRDPANQELAQMLSVSHRQKLDLLRRTAQLSSRI